MSINLYGRWSLTVSKAVHTWENRFRVEGATSGNGVYPPTVGSEITVAGPAWALIAEYRESSAQPWKPSEMMIDPGIDRVAIRAVVGAEDPLPTRDFEDIQWDARYLDGTLFEIPYRPYAVRVSDLFQMPDGIFETALGMYYMAVRVTNRWGLPFTDSHVLDITPQSRAALAMRGISVSDAWTHGELAALGQSALGTGIVLGPLVPGASRTVYFKVNVEAAAPRKHDVEFVCWNMDGMLDPDHPARRIGKQIFVSRTTIDQNTGEVVAEVYEGTLRMSLKEFAFDRETAHKRRRRIPPLLAPSDAPIRETLRDTIRALLDGKPVDPCLISRLLACYCAGGPLEPGTADPGKPRDGRFVYDPFYLFPTKFTFSVTPRDPYDGQYGAIPYDDPWWKVLLLIIAFVLLIAAALESAADAAYHDEDLVIGRLDRWQQNDIDAALCRLDTDRSLGFLQVLDAQSDEDNQNFVTAIDGLVALNAPIMTKAEVESLLEPSTAIQQRRVFKSGATTGLTHGIISALAPTGHDEATWGIDQLVIDPDPAFGENVSIPGDSGSIWVHTSTLRPVALHHTGRDDPDQAWASLLEDVFGQLGVTL